MFWDGYYSALATILSLCLLFGEVKIGKYTLTDNKILKSILSLVFSIIALSLM